MEAVTALYSEGDQELAEAIVSSLGRAVFSKERVAPAGSILQVMASVTYHILKWTTTRRSGGEVASFHNPILEISKHPYAKTLLASTRKEAEALVEGGDPMNGPYMMLSPEIQKAGTAWDKTFFDSVQSRDVQCRFIWETRATYEAATRRLAKGDTVRMKALAAGTGLSMILAYDRIVRDGFDPSKISVRITDRDPTNTDKTRRLLAKLDSTRERASESEEDGSISAATEDIFESGPVAGEAWGPKHDLVTAVGILEYLQGFTCDTTERRMKLDERHETATAVHLATRLDEMTAAHASLIVNTYRPHASVRILELFGKKFDYRDRENLSALMATANFRAAHLVGSGNIYDVEVYEKCPPGSTDHT